MNKLISTVLATVAFAAISIILTLPARASDFAVAVTPIEYGMVVEILDEAQLERELGDCDGRYYIQARVGTGVRTFDLSSGRATITTATTSAPPVAPQFFCAGENRGFPTSVDYR